MWSDIRRCCNSCLNCATHTGQSQKIKPPTIPIPTGSKPFEMVGVDVLQLPETYHGNKYAVVFMDHFTMWPEVIAVPDQTAETIASGGAPHNSTRGPKLPTFRPRGQLPLTPHPGNLPLVWDQEDQHLWISCPDRWACGNLNIRSLRCFPSGWTRKVETGTSSSPTCFGPIEQPPTIPLVNHHSFYFMAGKHDSPVRLH